MDRLLKVVEAVRLLAAALRRGFAGGIGIAEEGVLERGIFRGILSEGGNQSAFPAGIAALGAGEGGHVVVVAGGIHLVRLGELTKVAEAGRGTCTFTRTLQSGQQHGRQNRDNADDDQQLNEGKRLFAMFHFELTFRLVLFCVCYVCMFRDSGAFPRRETARIIYYTGFPEKCK